MEKADPTKRISKIHDATEKWLSEGNTALQKAIQKTVDEGLFSREDIEFQISVLKESISNHEIEEWAKRSGLNGQQNARGQKILCLHAGNLPLVGFQTALGTILSGADYYGKLSRKDPNLLASFLDEIQKALPEQKVRYSTDIKHFEKLEADKVVFAGSEESIPEVKARVQEVKAAKPEAKYIIRNAKFSIAYLEVWNEEVGTQLAEAMLRYGGKGCRSVAVVMAEFGLDEVKEELANAIQAFWKSNPQYLNPAPDLKYQYAYNKAVERNQLWLEGFLIQESEELPEMDFTVNWVKGGEEKLRGVKSLFGNKVQSVYKVGKNTIESLEMERLTKAQRPPLWWQPDRVDVVKELIKKIPITP